jgi:hypothetical protein
LQLRILLSYPLLAELEITKMYLWKGWKIMNFQIDFIEDKVEFFEATDLKVLEKKIAAKIDENKVILLGVHSVSHQMHVNDKGQMYFTAVVHFKLKK